MQTSIDAPLILPYQAGLSAATPSAPASGRRRIALAAAVAGILLFAADHDWLISRYEDFTLASDTHANRRQRRKPDARLGNFRVGRRRIGVTGFLRWI